MQVSNFVPTVNEAAATYKGQKNCINFWVGVDCWDCETFSLHKTCILLPSILYYNLGQKSLGHLGKPHTKGTYFILRYMYITKNLMSLVLLFEQCSRYPPPPTPECFKTLPFTVACSYIAYTWEWPLASSVTSTRTIQFILPCLDPHPWVKTVYSCTCLYCNYM